MRKLMFYSFKGGSGRTTACANVAAALAKSGQRVLCIDLDLAAPGLHTVFGVSDRSVSLKEANGITTRRYLEEATAKEPEIKPEEMRQIVIDVPALINSPEVTIPSMGPVARTNLAQMVETGPFGKLDIIAAGEPKIPDLVGDYPSFRLDELCRSLADDYDFIIFDGASGLRDLSGIGMQVCDLIVLFFKLGYQSLSGTTIMINILNQRTGSRFKPYVLVASNQPEPAGMPDEDQRVYQGLQETYIAGIRRAVEAAGQTCRMHSIREYHPLKWQDRMIVFDDLLVKTDYDTLATFLMDVTQSIEPPSR